ncbi:hypothetical protein D0C36_05610 [Mucilaginibacter conchicola]|uniref:Uncharacterized protein n=1 Tax=Mucilaginibacter conchicola TaxID=2303333 RepID=A0A372NYN6_9SPHI|nr:hypothetical protein [Mucilaginibacter conchicola]RFZ95004.1 hypothetical protein D0C36_05610 [Mucilaginibacter conchicola]
MMKLLFLLGCLFFCFNVSGKAMVDTTDYWHVKIKGFQIAEFDERSPKPAITLNIDKLSPADIMTVTYGNDTPCGDCTTNLYVLDDKSQRIVLAEAKGTSAALNVSVEKLKQTATKLKKRVFQVFYTDKGKRNRSIFRLNLGK